MNFSFSKYGTLAVGDLPSAARRLKDCSGNPPTKDQKREANQNEDAEFPVGGCCACCLHLIVLLERLSAFDIFGGLLLRYVIRTRRLEFPVDDLLVAACRWESFGHVSADEGRGLKSKPQASF
jgi:hypothetical protein